MKKLLSLFILYFSFFTFGFSQKAVFRKVEIDTNYSFRGLSVVDDSVAWVSGIHGIVGRTTNGGKAWKFTKVKGCEKMDFRTLYAFNAKEAIIANAGSPAYIIRTADGGITWITVYTNKDSLAFLDEADFWNEREGIMCGDPIDGHILLLHTNDGGRTWQELPQQSRPAMAKGEACFAASGTAIRCYGSNKVIIGTGGMASHLFVSDDNGRSWESSSPSIIQGKETTGIFSIAFMNEMNGIIVGGDYKQDTLKPKSALFTRNGGRTWETPKVTTGGYRECVEFVGGGIALACGPGGADISANGGITWTAIKDQFHFHVIRKARKGRLVIAAGSGRLSLVSVTK